MPLYPIRKRSGSALCSSPTVGRSARPGSRIPGPVPSIGCVPIGSRRGSRLRWRGRMAHRVATDPVLGYPVVKINASEFPSTSLGVGPMEDHQLVERSRAGDVAAFEELVKRHQGRAYAVAYRMLRNREDAQEVAQEAFTRAYFRLAEFRGTAQFKTWLYRILVILARDQLRPRRPEGA